jgi:hypothetical protein
MSHFSLSSYETQLGFDPLAAASESDRVDRGIGASLLKQQLVAHDGAAR